MRVLDEVDGVICQVGVEVVALGWRGGRPHRVVVVGELGVILVGVAAKEAVVALEASAERPPVEGAGCGCLGRWGQVPLADAEGVVAVVDQDLGQHAVLEPHGGVERWIAERELGDRRQADGVVVATCEQACPSRRAQGRGVEVRVAQPTVGETIQVRGLAQAPERAQLAVTDVIENHDDHIGRTLRRFWTHRPCVLGGLEGASDRAREWGAGGIGPERGCHGAIVGRAAGSGRLPAQTLWGRAESLRARRGPPRLLTPRSTRASSRG